MKSKVLKKMMMLLGFGGVATVGFVACAYGSPHAEYKVMVDVYDKESGYPVMGIKVSVVENEADTVALGLTNKQGNCTLFYSDEGFGKQKEIKIGIDDIDDTAHDGKFTSDFIIHTIYAKDMKDGDGDFDQGTAYIRQKFALKKMPPQD